MEAIGLISGSDVNDNCYVIWTTLQFCCDIAGRAGYNGTGQTPRTSAGTEPNDVEEQKVARVSLRAGPTAGFLPVVPSDVTQKCSGYSVIQDSFCTGCRQCHQIWPE